MGHILLMDLEVKELAATVGLVILGKPSETLRFAGLNITTLEENQNQNLTFIDALIIHFTGKLL